MTTCISQVSMPKTEATWNYFKQGEFLLIDLTASKYFGRADGANSRLYSSGNLQSQTRIGSLGKWPLLKLPLEIWQKHCFYCCHAGGHQILLQKTSCFQDLIGPARGAKNCQTQHLPIYCLLKPLLSTSNWLNLVCMKNDSCRGVWEMQKFFFISSPSKNRVDRSSSSGIYIKINFLL